MISVFRLKTAMRTDERVRLMNEIVSGIQVIKMYAWEKPFAKLVDAVRRYEIKSITKTSYMRGIQLSFIMYSTRISIFGSILAYVLLGHNITAEKVFVLTCFYNILRQTMTVFFPSGIGQVAEALVSIGRLNKFMQYDETEIAKALKEKGANEKRSLKPENTPGIFLKNASAKWTATQSDNTLTNITLSVTPGALLAVIGPVGSGKSSLFHVILQELVLNSGNLRVNGEISYASQEPWLFAGSVRQNILFGQPMDKPRYNTVVRKCALERDFQLLPHGDKTVVGDRGISLSGGQRARINLARAVYKKADIYLLDDPLSAVDTHVGKALFDQCITRFLRDKTVVLVTHQLQYLKDVDHIVLLDDGFLKAEGTYKELRSSGLDFTNLLSERSAEDDARKNEFERQPSQAKERTLSIHSSSSVEDTPQLVEEHRSSGSVGFKVYSAYFKAGGNACTICLTLFLFLVAQFIGSLTDYFITFWVYIEQQHFLKDHRSSNNTVGATPAGNSSLHSSSPHLDIWHFSRETCMYIYSTLMVLLIIFTMVRVFVFFSVCMRASTNLHNNMFQNITRAAMSFFNTNSAGRILNRFSKVDGGSHLGMFSRLWSRGLWEFIDNTMYNLGVMEGFSFAETFGGNVGLGITQAIGLTGMLQWGIRQSTELENQMTSVERVIEYNSIESEGDLESSPEKKPPKTWPSEGKIEFKHVSLRYFASDPPVLEDLCFAIESKEKIGIVGRTGAGKSSLINALFQLSDTTGSILIDDVDITQIGLHDLRPQISIIPQEPVLFSGTMRKNLDPFDDFSDIELWSVLDEVELKEVVEELPAGLSSQMSEGGANFSVGQRQLVCLARAILRNNKVLVMDEATANVDPQTDALIQQTIRRKFKDCTVLTIAHRLNTVMDSDKILVMDAGTVKEFDRPFVLLQDKTGVLYGMVQQTGLAMSEELFNVAKRHI
ncbi:probable multidrug resistance-associated protein lethal(2)03659 [Dendroctonus ponderosae]|uniref:probable multidrug resistance-associated protein lethal(2)03659 n=1 Tax=Dendroctonus ponderosae TaxID=77166 RepID=UPI002035595F|nr:probable multidrug resistance-associated protein lethal(2)03659 [Dendroctonus ponderosae]